MTFLEALKSPNLKRVWPWILTSLPVLVIIQYQAVAPVGHSALLIFELPYLLALVTSTGAILVLPFFLIRRTNRMAVLAWLLAAVIYLPFAIGGFVLGSNIRHRAFERLALRSTSLVSAINTYAEKQGHPPSSLADLVPDYISHVPRTGMMAYPEYLYMVGTNAQRFDGNPWVLVVHTPSGGINFDQFMYFPLQNYPDRGYGGSLVRIQDWAYVHE